MSAEPTFLCTLLALTLGEFVWRFGRAIRECLNNYATYKYQTIFMYSFTFSKPSIILLIFTAVYAAMYYNDLSNVFAGIWNRKDVFIIYLLCHLVCFGKSTFYYSDIIRSDTGLDYATGMASNYFHGYLKLALPSIDEQKDNDPKHLVREVLLYDVPNQLQRPKSSDLEQLCYEIKMLVKENLRSIMATWDDTFYQKIKAEEDAMQSIVCRIRERILNYEEKYRVRFAVKRLFILIPSSLHTSPVLKSKIMEREDNRPLEGVKKDRAGVSRPYINDVYRILIDGQYYYISVEGATPLLSYLESLSFDLTSTWQMKEMQREITLKFYKYLKKILSQYHETVKQVELVYYNDRSPEGHLHDVGEILVSHIKSVWEKDEIESLSRY